MCNCKVLSPRPSVTSKTIFLSVCQGSSARGRIAACEHPICCSYPKHCSAFHCILYSVMQQFEGACLGLIVNMLSCVWENEFCFQTLVVTRPCPQQAQWQPGQTPGPGLWLVSSASPGPWLADLAPSSGDSWPPVTLYYLQISRAANILCKPSREPPANKQMTDPAGWALKHELLELLVLSKYLFGLSKQVFKEL